MIEGVPTHDVLVVIGDLNAKIANENLDQERAIGKHEFCKMNENGERIIDLVIGGTFLSLIISFYKIDNKFLIRLSI